MPNITSIVFKMQKPAMSLKQFMLRNEVLKLYRGFMRLGRLIEEPKLGNPDPAPSSTKTPKSLQPMQLEWVEWVRAEFNLRRGTTDEEAVKMMLAHGKRQLQEMERTILLATNRNCSKSVVNNENSASVSSKHTCSKH